MKFDYCFNFQDMCEGCNGLLDRPKINKVYSPLGMRKREYSEE